MRTVLVLVLLASVTSAAPRRAMISTTRAAQGVTFPTAVPICDALRASGQMTGGWWCLNAAGTMETGSAITLSSTGSPVIDTWAICPSGPNCATQSYVLLNPTTAITQYFVSPTVPAPTGSFTTCAFGMVDNPAKVAPNQYPQTPLVMYSENDGDTAKVAWATQSAGANLSQGVEKCAPACGTSLSSGVTSIGRILFFSCGVFTSGVQTSACQFHQGDSTMVCTDFAHAATAITSTQRKWTVGIDMSKTIVWHGFMRGAFMTEAALTVPQMTTIASALMPVKPVGMTFTRAGIATCCPTPGQCVELNTNVPCVLNGVARAEAATINIKSLSESPGSMAGSNVGSSDPVKFVNNGLGPFGITQADRIDFGATSGAGYSRLLTSLTHGTGVATRFAVSLKGVSGSGVMDLCGSDLSYHCSVCTFTATDWTDCSVSWTTTAANAIYIIGNISVAHGTARAASSVYVSKMQAQATAAQGTAYVNTNYGGIGTSHAIETCSGTGC